MIIDTSNFGRASLTYFRRIGEAQFEPLDTGFTGGWAPDQMPGPMITGLLCHAGVEAARDLNPAQQLIRASFDLFTRVRMEVTGVRTEVVRQGRMISLIDVYLTQHGRDVARAHLFFGYAGQSPDNGLWTLDAGITPPPADLLHDDRKRLHFYRGGGGWHTTFMDFPGGVQRGLWQRPFDFVEGEPTQGFVLAGFLTDLTNFVANFGDKGVQHINIDATVNFIREPQGEGMGILAQHTLETAGISAGNALLFDAHGPLALTSVSSIAHSRQQ